MNRRTAHITAALIALLMLCSCASSMRGRYAEHLTTVVKPGSVNQPAAYPDSTALSAVSDY